MMMRDFARYETRRMDNFVSGTWAGQQSRVRNPFHPTVREAERAKRTAVNVVQKRRSRR